VSTIQQEVSEVKGSCLKTPAPFVKAPSIPPKQIRSEGKLPLAILGSKRQASPTSHGAEPSSATKKPAIEKANCLGAFKRLSFGKSLASNTPIKKKVAFSPLPSKSSESKGELIVIEPKKAESDTIHKISGGFVGKTNEKKHISLFNDSKIPKNHEHVLKKAKMIETDAKNNDNMSLQGTSNFFSWSA
jgi:hypothetical protein